MYSNLPDGVRERDIPGYDDADCPHCEDGTDEEQEDGLCIHCEGTGTMSDEDYEDWLDDQREYCEPEPYEYDR